MLAYTRAAMDAILVEHLRKSYGSVEAVADVSFAVREGEVFGLLGPNGAGKSTTVRILATLTHPDAGRALVAGHDVVREGNAVRASIGYVAQNSGVDRYLTGRENVALQMRAQRVSGAHLRERVNEMLRLVGLEEAGDRIVRTYSGGMRRRLDIAVGLVHRPSVLFLDEPTTGLDPEARVEMWTELERLAREQSLTILLTTHYLEEADQLADRLVIVSHGRVVAGGTPEQLKHELRGDSITLELADGQGDEARQTVARLPAVHETTLDGALLRARVEHGAQSLPAILSTLEDRGIAVASATVARPSLDDVYLHHTGHSFRKDDEA
ncbi:MAG: ATP-binding cassette domain-containing protein [Gaiellaceae bacterium]